MTTVVILLHDRINRPTAVKIPTNSNPLPLSLTFVLKFMILNLWKITADKLW